MGISTDRSRRNSLAALEKEQCRLKFYVESYKLERVAMGEIKQSEQRWMAWMLTSYAAIAITMLTSDYIGRVASLGPGDAAHRSVFIIVGLAVVHILGVIWLVQAAYYRRHGFRAQARLFTAEQALGVRGGNRTSVGMPACPGYRLGLIRIVAWGGLRVRDCITVGFEVVAEGVGAGSRELARIDREGRGRLSVREVDWAEWWRKSKTSPGDSKRFEIGALCFGMLLATVVIILRLSPEAMLPLGDGLPMSLALLMCLAIVLCSWPLFLYAVIDRKMLGSIFKGQIVPLYFTEGNASDFYSPRYGWLQSNVNKNRLVREALAE